MPFVLALNPVLANLLMLLFIAVAVIMILIVLIQKPAGGGLSGAFGASSGSGQTAFGAKTGDALTIMTIGTFVVFILTAIMLVYTSRPPTQPPGTPTAAPLGVQDQTPPPQTDPTQTPASTTPAPEPEETPEPEPDPDPEPEPEPGS